MALPSFVSVRIRRRGQQTEKTTTSDSSNTTEATVPKDKGSDEAPASTSQYQPGVDLNRATQTRRNAIIISSFSFFLSVIFLILTTIGNINTKPVIQSTYFFKLDLSSVFPQAFDSANLVLVNSIARSIGLHDFYQVGLWSYCEGYFDEGITYCSPPTSGYWFNPVQIILSELLSGATIALPTSVLSILNLIQLASRLMSAFFVTGAVLNFLSVFFVPFALYSRWYSLPLSIFTFVAALLTTAAAIIATVMFSIMRNVLTSQPGLNIGATLGVPMLVFMWIGAGGSLVGFGIQLCLSCCCASRRDVKTGRKMGSRGAYGEETPVAVESEKKHPGRRRWVRTKTPAEEEVS